LHDVRFVIVEIFLMDYHVDGAIYKAVRKYIFSKVGDLVEGLQFTRVSRQGDCQLLAP